MELCSEIESIERLLYCQIIVVTPTKYVLKIHFIICTFFLLFLKMLDKAWNVGHLVVTP